jgi:hypothetical protein
MPSTEALGAYLNDHLAGSMAGRDVAAKLAEDNEGTPLGSVMKTLLADIEADQATLEQLMDGLGIERQSLKQAGGWMAAKLTRVRFSQSVTGSAALSQLLEMEMLSVGIHGKKALWRALAQVSGTDPRLAAAESLAQRADDQLQRLESQRLAAAAEALS